MAALAVLLVGVSPAAAEPTPDVSAEPHPMGYYLRLSDDQWVQTLTPTRSGVLTAIQFPQSWSGKVRVRDLGSSEGATDGTVLGEARIDGTVATFTDEVRWTAGKRVALQLVPDTWVDARNSMFGYAGAGLYHHGELTPWEDLALTTLVETGTAPTLTPVTGVVLTTGTPTTAALVSVAGYPAPTVTVVGGHLPDGVTLAADGTLVGAPTQRGTFTVEVQADNGTAPTARTTVDLTVNALPAAPAGVSATAGEGAIEVRWDAPTDDGGLPVLSYDAEVSADGGSTWRPLDVAGRATTAGGLAPGVRHVVRVRALTSAGPGAWATAEATPFRFAPALSAPDGTPAPTSVAAGASLEIHAEDLPAGARLTVELHSTPVTLASLIVPADGTVSTRVTIPRATPAGAHHVVIALDVAGTVPVEIPLTVVRPVLVVPPDAGTGTAAPGDPTVTAAAAPSSAAATRLAATGVRDVAPLATWAVGLLAVGATSVVWSRARTRRVYLRVPRA